MCMVWLQSNGRMSESRNMKKKVVPEAKKVKIWKKILGDPICYPEIVVVK